MPAENSDINLSDDSGFVTESIPNTQTAQPQPVEASAPPLASPKKPLWPAVALAMLVVGGLVGWRVYNRFRSVPLPEVPEAITSNRLPVRVVRIEPGIAQGWVFDEGVSLPVQLRVLTFEANGDVTYVASINGVELREGDIVQQGQLLATIDNRKQTSSIETADADVQVADNQRDQSAASLRKARASLEKAESDLALAETELRRYEALFTEGAVSESDRDAYKNRVDQAEAAFKTAQEDILSAQDGLRSAEASINAAQARLNQTTVDLEDTQLISPIDGVVAYINIQAGEYWSTQYLNTSTAQNVIETAPIVVVDPSTYEVELEIQTDRANAIKPGQKAYVVLEEAVSASQAAGATQQDLLATARQQGSEGSVFAVSPSQTPGGRGTKVSIRNLQQVRNLKVGGRVYVWIEVVATPNAIVIPLGAILTRDQESSVFVVNETEGTVQRRRVTPGVEGLSGMEILSGVESGDLLVIEGQNRLVDGAPVEIINREIAQ